MVAAPPELGSRMPLGAEDVRPVTSGSQVVGPRRNTMLGSVQHVGALGRLGAEIFFALDGRLRYVFWSREAEKFTGIPRSDAVGRSLYEVFPEAVGSPAEGLYLDVLRARCPGGFITEWDGTCYEVVACPASEGLVVFAREIARPRQADCARVEGDERFWTFFDQLPVAAAIVRDGRIMRANESFMAMFGHSERSDLENTSLAGHFDTYSRPGVGELLRALLTDASQPAKCRATAHGSDVATLSVWVMGRRVETPDGPALACFLLEA